MVNIDDMFAAVEEGRTLRAGLYNESVDAGMHGICIIRSRQHKARTHQWSHAV